MNESVPDIANTIPTDTGEEQKRNEVFINDWNMNEMKTERGRRGEKRGRQGFIQVLKIQWEPPKKDQDGWCTQESYKWRWQKHIFVMRLVKCLIHVGKLAIMAEKKKEQMQGNSLSSGGVTLSRSSLKVWPMELTNNQKVLILKESHQHADQQRLQASKG